MIDFDGDLDEMLSDDDFGIVVIHNGVEIEAIFSDDYFENSVGEPGVEGSQPMLYVKETVEFQHDDLVTVNGKSYRVRNVYPSNTGHQEVMLHGPL